MRQPTRTRTITWEDREPNFERARSLTGMEYLQAIMNGALPAPVFAAEPLTRDTRRVLCEAEVVLLAHGTSTCLIIAPNGDRTPGNGNGNGGTS